MDTALIEKTELFVKELFQKFPHFSFNDWHVMYDHSVLVKNNALKILEQAGGDATLVAIGGLLHDIGKTYPTDLETLRTSHEMFNIVVAADFIQKLDLPAEQFRKLVAIVSYQSNLPEMKMITDADALAFYQDKRLYMLFIDWASKNNLMAPIRGKIEKFSKFNFPISKTIGRAHYNQMKKDWSAYKGMDWSFHKEFLGGK